MNRIEPDHQQPGRRLVSAWSHSEPASLCELPEDTVTKFSTAKKSFKEG